MPPKILASSNRVDRQTDRQVQVRWKVFMQYLGLGLCTESYRSLDYHLYCLICIVSAWCGNRMLRTFTPCRDDAAASHMNGNFPSITGCRVAGVLFALLLMHRVTYLAGVAVQEICPSGSSSPKMGLLSIQLQLPIIENYVLFHSAV